MYLLTGSWPFLGPHIGILGSEKGMRCHTNIELCAYASTSHSMPLFSQCEQIGFSKSMSAFVEVYYLQDISGAQTCFRQLE